MIPVFPVAFVKREHMDQDLLEDLEILRESESFGCSGWSVRSLHGKLFRRLQFHT